MIPGPDSPEPLRAVPTPMDLLRQEMITRKELSKAVLEIKLFILCASVVTSGLTLTTLYFLLTGSRH